MTTASQEGRLHRSQRDRIVFGVCAGLGDYFEIDPALVRLAFVLITLAGGAGVLAYIILALVLPEEGAEPIAGREGLRHNARQLRAATGELASGQSAAGDEPFGTLGPEPGQRRRSGEMGGFILIALGLLFLLGNLGWMHWFDWRYLWPIILIALGVMLLIKRAERAR